MTLFEPAIRLPRGMSIGALEDQADASIGLLDPDLRIHWVSEGWRRFAADNGGDALTAAPLGRSYVEAISEPLRSWYGTRLGEVLSASAPWEHDYECPSPELRRLFRLTAYPLRARGGEGLLLVHTLRLEEPHEASASASPLARYVDGHGLLHVCSHCRRTRRPESEHAWDWVPEALVTRQHLVSHGLCRTCADFHYGVLLSEGSAGPEREYGPGRP